MNRRHFLKFIPLIPVAIGLVKLPKIAESTTPVDWPELEGIDTLLARQKAFHSMMVRSCPVIPGPADGISYTKEEVRRIVPLIAERIDLKLAIEQIEKQLNQKAIETLAGATGVQSSL